MGTVGQPGAICPAEAVSALLGWIEMTVRQAACEAVASVLGGISSDGLTGRCAPPGDGGSRFLTVSQAAGELGTGRSTVYDLVRAGKVEAIRVGEGPTGRRAALRIFRDSFEAYIERQRVTTGVK